MPHLPSRRIATITSVQMKQTNAATIEDLRSRLRERAEMLLQKSAEKREKAAQVEKAAQLAAPLTAKPGKVKKNQVSKSTTRFEKWLTGRIQKESRFHKRIFGGFQSHRALYEELQRFASETGKLGEETNLAHEILQAQIKALAGRTDAALARMDAARDKALASVNARIAQSDCSEVVAAMSRELAELRRKVEYLSQQNGK